MTDVGVGDAELATLVIAPADNTTEATLTVHAPGGTSTPVSATGGALEAIPGTSPQQYSQRWTATSPVTYTAAGRWVLSWTVTGTGEGAEDYEVWVVASPVAGGPTWTPGRSKVAAYVPHRTLTRTPTLTGSKDSYQFTFDSTTVPDGVVVDKLIADSAAVIASRIPTLHASSEPVVSALTALRAAVWVERSWPKDDQSLQRASDMEKQFNTELAALIKANQDANDADNGTQDGFDVVFPVWAYPPADPRWDYPTYW